MHILYNQYLKPYNTFGVNNRAQILCFLQTIEDLKAFQALPGKKVILGGGSNVLITQDLEIVGINQFLQEPQPIPNMTNKDKVMTKVGSGYKRDEFVQRTLKNGYCGLENMGLIPGSVGAGALGNIGAYGKEIEEFIYEVEYIDLTTFETKILTHDECKFSYRWSIFKTMSDYFISSVTFVLPTQEQQLNLNYPDVQAYVQQYQLDPASITPKQLYDIICSIRTSKMPSRDEFGTAGSFFKNPIVAPEKLEQLQIIDPDIKYFANGDNYKIAAGYLLEKLGYRGKMVGKVGCYRNQALILVNQGGNGQEIDEFAKKLEERVAQVYGIQLEREIIRI